MKFIRLLLSLVLLVGCSTKDDYCFVEEDLLKIYSVPYIEVVRDDLEKSDEAIDILSERFKDDFSEDTLMKHIAIQTFIYLNDVDENIKIDDKNLSDFIRDFSPFLEDFENAIKDNDTVTIGDIAEYEIKPRFENFCEVIKEM